MKKKSQIIFLFAILATVLTACMVKNNVDKHPLVGAWQRDSLVVHDDATGNVVSQQNYATDYWIILTDESYIVVGPQGNSSLSSKPCYASFRLSALEYRSDSCLLIDSVPTRIKSIDANRFDLYWSPRPGLTMTEHWTRKPRPAAIEQVFK